MSIVSDERVEELLADEAELTRLRKVNAELLEALKIALRQWNMYADITEGNEGFDLKKETSAEGDIYRHALAVVAKATGILEG